MVEAVEPVTRLSVAALALGWLNCTVFGCPTENEFQLITAREELCVTVNVLLTGVPLFTCPDTTGPFWGSAVCAYPGAVATNNTPAHGAPRLFAREARIARRTALLI